MKKTDKALLSAAVAGILGALAAGPSRAADATQMMDHKTDDVACSGVNACKGKSSCGTAKSGCAGS